MKTLLPKLILLGFASSTVGCALCSSPYDYDYVTYGSKTPRTNMKCGRVGSPFSDGQGTAEVVNDFQVLDGEEIIESDVQESEMMEEDIMLLPDSASVDNENLQNEEAGIQEIEVIDNRAPVRVASAIAHKPNSRASLSDDGPVSDNTVSENTVQSAAFQSVTPVRSLPKAATRSISGRDALFDE